MQDSDPQASGIFDGEDNQRNEFDQIERERVALLQHRHGFECRADQVENDEQDQQPVEIAAGPAPDRALFQNLVDAGLQFRAVAAPFLQHGQAPAYTCQPAAERSLRRINSRRG